jgi:hypothetical protein
MQEIPEPGIFSTEIPFRYRLNYLKSFPFNKTPPKSGGPGLAPTMGLLGDYMGERRKAKRYEVYLPLQVCMSRKAPAEFHTAQLRDISRAGVFFHSNARIETGAGMELTFALPAERNRGTSVLVRASAKALRVSLIENGANPLYGVAATIDRLDFVRPVATNAA